MCKYRKLFDGDAGDEEDDDSAKVELIFVGLFKSILY